uniref:Uncharacterized protein n=1 Tax=Lynx canadensis TaxID=61383 RepID=A0A667HYI2_LYNCA
MAATFFGEVVKAPCRAGTEDQEEEEDERRETAEDREVRRQLARKSSIFCWQECFCGGAWCFLLPTVTQLSHF